MPIIHIVLCSPKPDSAYKAVFEQFFALQAKCVRPTSQEAYIKSVSGGRNMSPEVHLKTQYTHAFTVEFENELDREYYLHKDPAHLDLVEKLKDVVLNIGVLDYEPGVV